MIKTLNKVSIEELYLNLIKAIYVKPTANIILNGEKLMEFPLISETRQGCPLSLLFNTGLEVLATEVSQGKEIKGTQFEKKDVKPCLFTDDMKLYIENSYSTSKILLEVINKFTKVARYKINVQKSVHFHTPTMLPKRN